MIPQSINSMSDVSWFRESIETLKNDSSLSEEDINRIITGTIAEYILGSIGVIDLLEFADSLKNCKAKLNADLKYIIEDLSQLHHYKSDKQYIHNILIDALRKVTKT